MNNKDTEKKIEESYGVKDERCLESAATVFACIIGAFVLVLVALIFN